MADKTVQVKDGERERGKYIMVATNVGPLSQNSLYFVLQIRLSATY